MIEPQPCFVCGALPKVESFALMVSYKRGWTCLCPNKHYETDAYYDRDGAVEAWNRWVENEGWMDEGDEDEGEVAFDEQRYSKVCRLLEQALATMSEWGT